MIPAVLLQREMSPQTASDTPGGRETSERGEKEEEKGRGRGRRIPVMCCVFYYYYRHELLGRHLHSTDDETQ